MNIPARLKMPERRTGAGQFLATGCASSCAGATSTLTEKEAMPASCATLGAIIHPMEAPAARTALQFSSRDKLLSPNLIFAVPYPTLSETEHALPA